LATLPMYFARRSVDQLSAAFIHDIRVGIQRTNVRAAFLKCVTDQAGITPDVEKALRAVARAHLETGAPIMTHTHAASQSGLVQQNILEDEGVNLKSVMIGHSGDSDDLRYLERLVERGSYIGMDRYGYDDFLPTHARNAVVARMVQLGYASRMVLSHDSVAVPDPMLDPTVKALRAKSSLVYLVDEVIPQLLSLGVAQSAIDEMTVHAPSQWLQGIS